jgi:WD repeat-containing protein 34
MVIEVSNCVTEVAFHPSDPTMLAGGTMNGEIYLWNIAHEDDPQIAVSAVDEFFHREAIKKLIWVKQESLMSMAIKWSLVSTATDGKVLVWRQQDKLRFPVKGHMLSSKRGDATVGGTAMDKIQRLEDNTYLVGTEGGAVFKYNIMPPTEQDLSHLFESQSNLRWKLEAIEILANLPTKTIMEVKRKVERYVQDKGERDVWAATVFAAKPDIRLLYPVPSHTNYEKHSGPVTGISTSPFMRRLFLSCS